MAYNTIENSTDLGSPIVLFEFIFGNGTEEVYRYATSAEELALVGRIWSAQNMTHSEIVSSGSLDRAELTISAPADLPVGRLFLIAPPSRQVIVNIWRGHGLTLTDGEDEFIRIWTGRVLSPNWSGDTLELSCEAIATSLKRIGLRRYYQYGCPHVLYGPACRAPTAPYISTGYVINVVSTLTVDMIVPMTGGAPWDPSRFAGGIFTYDYEGGRRAMRTILSAESIAGGVRLRLMSGIPGMEPLITCIASYGCKHTWEACQQFANTVNYGGCPNIPIKDPYRTNTF